MTTSSDETTGTLHPRIAEIIGELEASMAALRETVNALSSEQLNAPANGEEWSVALILEHLTMTEDGMGRMFSKMLHDVEATGARETETSSILGINDEWHIATSDVRIVAPERVRPSLGMSPAESMQRIEASRARLLEVMRRGSGYALSTVSMPHPVFGPFNGYQWALANAQHMQRHIRQIRRAAGLGAS